MDQVDLPKRARSLAPVKPSGESCGIPQLLIIAGWRRSLRGWPPVCLKMNAAELASGSRREAGPAWPKSNKPRRLREHPGMCCHPSENGIVGLALQGRPVPALPVRGEIDIAGAGDAVTATLVAALAAGATLGSHGDVMAASVVIHQPGTTAWPVCADRGCCPDGALSPRSAINNQQRNRQLVSRPLPARRENPTRDDANFALGKRHLDALGAEASRWRV